jgi:ParB family chromosome partitioning protein
MTHALKSISVAIGDLTSHPANVRSNSPETYETEAIAHLTASIGVLGIIQPLLVQKIDGKFGVLAGGRRRAALNELVAEKTAKGFTNKTKIECRLVPDGFVAQIVLCRIHCVNPA